jgi:phage-related baseplate assembly protein
LKLSIEALNNLPEVNFINKDVNTMLSEAISEFEKAHFEATGTNITLAQADPRRIFLYTQVLRQYQAYQLIDFSAKQNLLKYAVDEYLDNFGARYGEKGKRQKAKAAITTVRYTLSALQNSTIPIPLENRTGPGNDLFFKSTEYAEIPAGQLYVDVPVECMTVGIVGNGYTSGQINELVDPIPFMKSVSNLYTTQGGTDIENNENLREKIYLAPESFSTAGPEGAYEFFAKEYLSTIADVKINSPSPGIVDIKFILENGELPTEAIIQGLDEYLSDKTRRPLTDNVQVGAPTQVQYNIDFTYYIKKSDEGIASTVQAKVNEAVEDYKLWQKTKIGRDVDPDELNSRIRAAGAKRATIIAPIFTPLTTEIAIENSVNIVYGGIEND